MHKIFVLAVTLLKGGGSSGDKRGKRKWLLPIILIVAFGSFAFSMIMMTFELYDVLAVSGVADTILPIAFGATSVMIFFFGVFYVVSSMYHADDIEILKYLPLWPYQILGAKFITLVVYEYIVESFILLPILIAYGIKSAAGVLFYIYSVLLFAVTPVIALAMASIIVMIVMRFTNFGKNKQAFKFVGGIIALVLALGVNMVIQSSAVNISQEQLMAIMSGKSSLVSVVSNIFPGIIFASHTLIYSESIQGFLNLLLFILCSFAAAAVFLGFGQVLYLKGVAGVTETSAKRKGVEDIRKQTAGMPAVRAYIKKEIRLLFRSPIAFLNCVLMNFLWPVIILIMLFGSGESIAQISILIAGLDNGIIMTVIIGAGAFLSSANAITSTAISREGKTLYITKYIPMSISKQLRAKTATGMIFSFIGVLFLVIFSVILGVEIWVAVVSLVLSFAAIWAASMIGILIDVAHPKLNWMNEQQAIKQNLNVLLHMLSGLVLAAAAIVPALLLNMNEVAIGVYILVLFILLDIILLKRVDRSASKLAKMDA